MKTYFCYEHQWHSKVKCPFCEIEEIKQDLTAKLIVEKEETIQVKKKLIEEKKKNLQLKEMINIEYDTLTPKKCLVEGCPKSFRCGYFYW